MIKALYSTLVEICDSKKALAVIATLISAAVAHLHWDVSPDAILPYLGLAAAYVVGQGVADHGKGAAEVIARTQALPPKPLAVVPKEAGFVRLQLIALLAIAGVTFGACSWFKKEAKTAGNDIVQCAEGDLVNLIPIAVEVAAGLLTGSISWSQIESSALAQGATIGGCFLADVQAQVAAAAATTGAGSSAPAMADAAHRALADGLTLMDDFRKTIGSKKHYKTADGVVR